jgi:hypothetical protein
MQLKNALVSLVIAASAGCVGEAHVGVAAPVAEVEVTSEPPPPPAGEIVVSAPRPGYVWIEGRHRWDGRRWLWERGRYEPVRVGYRYEQARYEVRGGRRVWIEGGWRR